MRRWPIKTVQMQSRCGSRKQHSCLTRARAVTTALGDENLGGRIVAQAVEALGVPGDGLAQFGDAGAGRVLVAAAFEYGVDRRPGDPGRAVPVGEALAQVDRSGRDRAGGHLGEDRGAHARQAPVEQWSFHGAHLAVLATLGGMRVALGQIPVSSRPSVVSRNTHRSVM